MRYRTFPVLFLTSLLALSLLPAAFAVGDTNATTLYGGGLSQLTACPTILEGSGGGVTNFVIGTTNATVVPIDISGCRNIGWEMTAQTTNTTSTLTAAFAFFNDYSSTAWYTAVSNSITVKCLTFPATTVLRHYGTNFSTDGFHWVIPLYVTNASQCASNITLRSFIKPGL